MATLFGRDSRATRTRRADFQADNHAATRPDEYLDTVAFAEAETRAHRSGMASDDPQILEWTDENYAAALAAQDTRRLADEDPAAVDLDTDADPDQAPPLRWMNDDEWAQRWGTHHPLFTRPSADYGLRWGADQRTRVSYNSGVLCAHNAAECRYAVLAEGVTEADVQTAWGSMIGELGHTYAGDHGVDQFARDVHDVASTRTPEIADSPPLNHDPSTNFDAPTDMNGLRPVHDVWVEMVEVSQMPGTSPDRIWQAISGYEVAAGYARDAGLDPANSGGPYELRFVADTGTTGTVIAPNLVAAMDITRQIQDTARAQSHVACLSEVTYQGHTTELDVPSDVTVAVERAAGPRHTPPALPAPQEQPGPTITL